MEGREVHPDIGADAIPTICFAKPSWPFLNGIAIDLWILSGVGGAADHADSRHRLLTSSAERRHRRRGGPQPALDRCACRGVRRAPASGPLLSLRFGGKPADSTRHGGRG